MNRFIRNVFSLANLIFFVSLSAPVFSQRNLSEPLPVSQAIKKGKLSNGLTYYIRQNSRPEKKVELRLVVKAGSILEDDDQLGLAHFTEHMAFNGSTHFKKNELVSFLQSIGVKFGADLNASTGFDETTYILPIPVDKPENLEKGFLVLEDWAAHVLFEAEETDKERGVVLEEDRLGKGAQERMLKKALPAIFEGSRYADRLPIGKAEILKTFKVETIRRFYRDWYRPDLMAVIAVGDIDPAQVEKMIESHFGKLKSPAKARPRVYADVPSRKQTRALVVSDPEATAHVIQIFYNTGRSSTVKTLGDYRTSLIKNLSTRMLSNRLQELTQKADPPFAFGGSSRDELVHGFETYFGIALIGKAGVKPAVEALIQENERARRFGFTASELDRAKKNALRSIEMAYKEREKTESEDHAEECIRNFTEEETIPGIENEYAYYQEFIPSITLEEINAYAAKSIPPVSENKLIFLQGPEKADFTKPTEAELADMVANAEKLPVTPYVEKAVAASLLEKSPDAGRIIFEKKNATVGTTTLTLGNGVTVILKPTDFKNDQVVLAGFRQGGQSLYGQADAIHAQYASMLVSSMGVGNFSPVDLRKVLAGKTVMVNPAISNLTEGVSGMSGSADLESMFQLIHLYFTSPRKDEELFKSFISKQEAFVQNMMSDPRNAFRDSTQKMLYNFHPRGPRFPRLKDFQELNLDRSLAIYRERFGNARGWTFVMAGSFDIAKIKPLIATYIASLPSAPLASTGFKDMGVRPVKGVVKKAIRKGQDAKSFISMTFTGEAEYNAKDAMVMQALLDVMNIKLIETLREELSGIYGGSMNGGMNKFPYGSYVINVNLPCGPENVDKLIAATFGEIKKIKDHGPKEEDVKKVKEAFSKQFQENLKDNNYWLMALQRSVEYGAPAEDILTVSDRMNAVTAAEIQAAAKRFFNENNYFQAVLYPEK